MDHPTGENLNLRSAVQAAGQLIAFSTSAKLSELELAERRRETLKQLGSLIGATAGFWAWGHGHPYRSPVVPVAIIDFGMTDELRGLVIEIGLSPAFDRWFRQPIAARMGDRELETTISQQIKEYMTRENVPQLFKLFELANWTDWMHSVRYTVSNNWSNLFLMRSSGPFNEQHAATVELAMSSICWLHANPEIQLSADKFSGLTNRQKTVMTLLLDGLSRKMIAKQLSLSEDTVSDHIKAIYLHFKVNSATELAAMFLRGA